MNFSYMRREKKTTKLLSEEGKAFIYKLVSYGFPSFSFLS